MLTTAGAGLLGGALWAALGDSAREGPPVSSGLLEAGAKIYASHCASCHGADLQGQKDWRRPLPDGSVPAPPHDASGHTWHHPDSQLFEITKFGGASIDSRMPAFEAVLSDAEIWAVLEFIKSRWPSRERKAQARATHGSHRR